MDSLKFKDKWPRKHELLGIFELTEVADFLSIDGAGPGLKRKSRRETGVSAAPGKRDSRKRLCRQQPPAMQWRIEAQSRKGPKK